MPDATITSTASTFGTISGTFAADQSTITGTVTGTVTGTLSGSVGVPGPQGPTGATGATGATGPAGSPGVGVPVGGTAGQFLTKIDGTNYNTDWTTVNLSVYAVKANNLSDLPSAPTARTNLGLGTMATATASDYSTTVAANGLYYPLSGNPSGFLTSAPVTSVAGRTGAITLSNTDISGLGSLAVVNDAPSDGSQYARKNAAWDVVVPGDRYLTSSTTSNTVSNGNKTFTIGAGLSYTPTQNITISYDASNHMHGEVLTYNSGTGVLTVDVNNHTGSGTYASWVVNVGGVTPATSVAWGAITGTLSSQTDLQNALDLKANLASPTFTGTPTLPTGTIGVTQTALDSTTALATTAFVTTADNLKAPLASPALTGNVTITSNSAGAALFIEQAGAGNILTLHDQASDTNFVAIDQNGKVSTIPSVTAGAGFNVAHGVAPTSPVNGDIWTTTAGLFARINAGTRQFATLSDGQSFSGNNTFTGPTLTFGNTTAASTVNIGTGATLTATTKAINIGTNGVSGSTTNITLGSATSGATNLITVNGPMTVGNNFTATGLNINIGTLTATAFYNFGTGGLDSGQTRTIGIGTNALAGSTNAITIGSTLGTSTTTLQGTTNGVTAAVDTNSTALATTAYVVGQAGSATPLVNGTAAVGTSLRYARQDHVHGTDTTRAPLASPTFTGTPSLPTGTIATTQSPGNNTTALATTAFVTAAVPAIASILESRQLTSTTKAMSPNDVLWAMMTQDYIDINRSGFTYTTAGVPQFNDVGSVTQRARLNATVASSVIGRPFGTSQVDQTSPFLFRNNYSSNINFNLKTYLSGRAGSFSLLTDGTFNQAFWYGKVEGDALGALTRRGFGWAWNGGTGSRFVNLVVHNGTTLTTVASSFAITQEVAFDWDLYSDGAGNVTLYINGSQVATSSAGPTSYQAAGTYAWWREEAYTTAAPTFANHTSYFTRGRAMILNY